MRVAVFAYHNIGYECLKVLIEANEEIVAVVTHEDDPKEEIWFSSVAELARRYHLAVYAPSNPNTPDFIALMRSLAPDLIFSFYYRRLLSKELLTIPPLGGINLHGSLLPKYRGRSPVNWVLINGETETGVTLHYMTEKADAGDVIAQRAVSIDVDDTALSLYRKLTTAAVELFKDSYPLIKSEVAPRTPQDSRLATTYGGRCSEDGRIVWEKSAQAIYNLIRAVTHPYPGAFTYYQGRKLYVWGSMVNSQSSIVIGQSSTVNGTAPGTIQGVEKDKGVLVSTGEGRLLLTGVQFEGEEEMEAGELVDRHHIPMGSRLG